MAKKPLDPLEDSTPWGEDDGLPNDLASEVRKGYFIIPVNPVPDKKIGIRKPYVKWRHRTEPASMAQVERWHKKWPKAHWAVVTGPVSGIGVVDVDGPEGIKSLRKLGTVQGKQLEARYKTPSGGLHVYFKLPDYEFRNGNVDPENLPGIELKGAGAMAHFYGTRKDGSYTYVGGPVYEFSKLPKPTRSAIDKRRKGESATSLVLADEDERQQTKDALTLLADHLVKAVPGNRNEVCRDLCYQLIDHGVDDDWSRYVVQEYARLVPTGKGDPFPPAEALETLANARSSHEARERYLPALEDRAVRERLEKLRVYERAAELLRDERAVREFAIPPSEKTLAQELEKVRPEQQYSLEDLHVLGTNSLLAAVYKAGKTTLNGNLMRSLVDEEPFLGYYDVLPFDGRVAFLNYELDADQFIDWLRKIGIRNTERVSILNLRGYRLPLHTPVGEEFIVSWLLEREVTKLVMDPFRRAYSGAGDENSNTQVGDWLATLNVIKRRAGVRDLFMTAHTGHVDIAKEGERISNEPERARGAASLNDDFDNLWYLTKDSHELGANRYFSAVGRGVDVPMMRLEFEAATMRLAVGSGVGAKGAGTRKETALYTGMTSLVAVVRDNPGIPKGDLLNHPDFKGSKDDRPGYVRKAVSEGFIRVDPPNATAGQRQSHFITEDGEAFLQAGA